MPLNPAFKRWAKFKGRYASKIKMNQYLEVRPRFRRGFTSKDHPTDYADPKDSFLEKAQHQAVLPKNLCSQRNLWI